MKLKDVTETGFYYNEQEGREILFEIYPNDDYIENFNELSEEEQEKLCEDKCRPYSKFLLDLWHFDREDLEGIKHWDVDGLVYTPDEYGDIEVVKDTVKYRLLDTQINAGCFLVEDKLTYKEKLDKILDICEKASTKSTFCNGVENKDMQKLAIKVMKVIGGSSWKVNN